LPIRRPEASITYSMAVPSGNVARSNWPDTVATATANALTLRVKPHLLPRGRLTTDGDGRPGRGKWSFRRYRFS